MSQGQDCAYSNIILHKVKLTISTEQNQLYVQNTELQRLKTFQEITFYLSLQL